MSDIRTEESMWAKLGNKLLKSNSLIFTYLRSIVSSQCAGWTDMLIGFILFSWLGLSPLIATMIGALCGGIINCIINYRFTFRAQGVDWRAVIVKYTFVWAGSMLLNSYGTQAIYSLISGWQWLQDIGFKPDGYYAAARLFTALMVSWFWNFVLQRYFVYRSIWLDKHIVNAMDTVGLKKSDK